MTDAHTATIPLPDSTEGLLQRLKPILALPRLVDIHITPTSIVVSRRIDPETEKVLPEDPSTANAALDADFVLDRLELLAWEFEPDIHPAIVAKDVMLHITDKGLNPYWLFSPAAGWAEAYFGVPEGCKKIYGMEVRVLSGEYESKIVFVGSPTNYLSDAVYGVIVDTGV